jgi:hypothetical protein
MGNDEPSDENAANWQMGPLPVSCRLGAASMREENLDPRKAVGRKIQRPSSLLSPNFLRRAAYFLIPGM